MGISSQIKFSSYNLVQKVTPLVRRKVTLLNFVNLSVFTLLLRGSLSIGLFKNWEIHPFLSNLKEFVWKTFVFSNRSKITVLGHKRSSHLTLSVGQKRSSHFTQRFTVFNLWSKENKREANQTRNNRKVTYGLGPMRGWTTLTLVFELVRIQSGRGSPYTRVWDEMITNFKVFIRSFIKTIVT